MKALSIRQPWAFAVLFLGKDCENRTWATNFRGTILIHTGATIDQSGTCWLREKGFVVPKGLPTSAYLGRVTIRGCRRRTVAERFGTGGSPWAFGPWCFELEDVEPLAEAIPGRGKLGLYEVDLEHLFAGRQHVLAASREGASLTLPLEDR